MKRILMVTGIVVGTVVAVTFIALSVLNAMLLRDCVDSVDEYFF